MNSPLLQVWASKEVFKSSLIYNTPRQIIYQIISQIYKLMWVIETWVSSQEKENLAKSRRHMKPFLKQTFCENIPQASQDGFSQFHSKGPAFHIYLNGIMAYIPKSRKKKKWVAPDQKFQTNPINQSAITPKCWLTLGLNSWEILTCTITMLNPMRNHNQHPGSHLQPIN